MKFLFLILSFSCCKNLLAQSDTSFPLSVNIKVDTAYEVKLPKKEFDYQVSRGEYNITTDSVKQKQYDIEIAIKNNAQLPIFIWMMTCSWFDNIKINNTYTYFKGWGCDANYPHLVKIGAGESEIYKITICKSIKFENPCKNCIYGPQVETTKFGLVIVDDIFKPKLDGFLGYHLAMEDQSLWKIIWSNPLYLLTEDEAHPKPVQIPVYKNVQR